MNILKITKTIVIYLSLIFLTTHCVSETNSSLREGFINPPDSARPGVYWYFMDGNLSREGITADLESMKEAGIGNVLFLEVNVGVPRGPVDFLSEEWQELYKHAVREAERLGIEITLGSGPGWAGSGGPWVKPEQSMQHLVASSTEVKGPLKFKGLLPKPLPKKPYFGEKALTKSLREKWIAYYEDVVVLAFPTPVKDNKIKDVDEKALYYRAPYTSRKNVKPYLPAPADYKEISGSAIDTSKIIDLSEKLKPDGTLEWNVPSGNWTIMRFGKRNNGAVTRPAPAPGLGFESDKFDTSAFNAHFDEYIGKLIKKVGPRKQGITGGWTMIHIDSWEMGAQNWTGKFRQEFQKRRGYDMLPFLPAYTGRIVGSLEMSERFLWDLRQTSMELILENHAGHFKALGRRHGLKLSIEPYDMNPTADLDLGAVADVPMGEFWTKGFGFNSSFSCIEATSIAHVYGRPVVAAEAFTAGSKEAWKKYPGNVKNQGDWAFSIGINKFVYHTFAHKPLGEEYQPGMTMGPYGVHWDRKQTWWSMASAYHKYVTRCQYILRQGHTVADVLYLTPEGAPLVFRPPMSALEGDVVLPDKRGYNFDGCSPLALIEKASVKNNRIVFPGGASYRLLVLPDFETMTPALLEKIESLVKEGAIIVGQPPVKSPSLSNYPECDQKVSSLAKTIWGGLDTPGSITERKYGKGKIYWGGNLYLNDSTALYPHYDATAALLKKMGVNEDFRSSGSIRYTHRTTEEEDIYFISNRANQLVIDTCAFRVEQGTPELWDPVTGETRLLSEYSHQGGLTSIPVKLEKDQSFFIVFPKNRKNEKQLSTGIKNFPEVKTIRKIKGAWIVSFDPKWGGPKKITFDSLEDWSKRSEEGIKYYSGIATYNKSFDLPELSNIKDNAELYLNLGKVKNLARVRLNGIDLGIIWTSPWRVNIINAVKDKGNQLEIEVANLWANRLIGDENMPDDGVKDHKWPEWLLKGQPRTSGRYTFTTNRYYKKDMELKESGLLGPVLIQVEFYSD
ncbi:MAG: glycosyl hydrolase [Chlorobi bacterium]|nr:glycosyl hydrolase [Chlorobiota bacterium]